MTNANEIRFRCSSLGYLMTEPRSKKDLISETTKTHLVDIFASAKYGRREEIQSKFLNKGNECEEDAITLLSRVTKIMFKKNDVRLTNEWITGELDLFLGDNIENADETLDTKVSWSLHTFLRAKHKPIESNYKWQGNGYMMLSNAKKHTVAYCLVNGTASAITDEKRKLSYQNGMLDVSGNPSEKYTELCKQIEINHIFDIELFRQHNPFYEFDNNISEWHFDIPMSERVYLISFDRNEEEIELIKTKSVEARTWMDENLFKVMAEKQLAA